MGFLDLQVFLEGILTARKHVETRAVHSWLCCLGRMQAPGSLLFRLGIQTCEVWGGGRGVPGLGPDCMHSIHAKPCPSVPSGGIGQSGKQGTCVSSTHAALHTTLASASQLWEGSMPSGRHPSPTKGALLELEVRICGRWDSWVRVPAACQSSECWANISGTRSSVACPARPSGR